MARAVLLLALAVALALAARPADAKKEPHPAPGRALVSQLPAPLWSSGLAVTWEAAGNPLGPDGAPGPLLDPDAFSPAPAVAVAPAATGPVPDLRDNPLLDESSFFPRWDEVQPEHVVPGMRAVLANLSAEFDALEAGVKPTWEGLLVPLERIADKFEYTWGIVGHLRSVRESKALRAAVAEVQPEVVALELRMAQSRPLYDGLKALKAGPQWAGLTAAQQRVVDLQLKDLELGGVGLSGKDRERYNAIQQELAQLTTTFANNVLDSTSAFKRVVTRRSEVDGLPQTALHAAAQQARAAGYATAASDAGPWVFTLDGPSYSAVLTYAGNRTLREELYRASIAKASSGKTDNVPVIERLLELRREAAQLLGFKNFAQRSMATKMATLATAEQLLEELRTAALPIAKRDHEELKAFARDHGHPGELQLWDVSYWAEKLRVAKYDISDEDLKPYLALPNVLEGMFKVAKRLFDVDVVPADGKSPVWHPDVKVFEVRAAATGKPISFVYFDPYLRAGEKRSGAWMNSVISRSKVFKGPGDTTPRLPVALAVTNQAAPVNGAPGLLKFGEVETLFHEFGHTLQHMLTTVDEGLVSGIRGVPWDAVELASQFMENWPYDKPTLKSFAKHYVTGEPLPDTMYDRLIAAKNFRSAASVLRQVNLATKDLELHSCFVPGRGESIFDVDRRVGARTLVMQPLPEDRSLCSFGHIFTGGYSAGYYSYKWSEVLSTDAFEAFVEAGLGDEAAVRATGARYAATVLGLGGSVPAGDVFKRFRGRGPSTAPLLRSYGLLPGRRGSKP